MSGITVERVGGRLLAVKRADPDRPDRLRHEAAVLERLHHPGLVEPVEFTDGEQPVLRTVFAGPDSWDRQPPRGEGAVVTALAALAAVVADLHDLGTAHGALAPAHVVVATDGRPLLCGLGDARPADPDARADDVTAFGALVADLASDQDGDVRRRLVAVAEACRAGSIDARTAGRRLDDIAPGPTTVAGRDPRRQVVIVGSLVGSLVVGVVMVGAAAIGWPGGGPSASTDLPAATGPGTITSSTTTTTTTTTTAPRRASTTITASGTTTAAPALGGVEVVSGGRRYGVGREGDVVVLGDWDCDGVDTPAVLRPSTATVAVFDLWPPPGGAAEPAQITVVAGATDLVITTDGPCDQVRVRTPGGSLLVPVQEVP